MLLNNRCQGTRSYLKLTLVERLVLLPVEPVCRLKNFPILTGTTGLTEQRAQLANLKPLLHEGDGIYVYGNPHPVMMKHGGVFSQKLTDKLMQGLGVPAF